MRKPTTAELLEEARRAAVGPVKVAQPAWVMSYDRTTQTATVQVATAYQVKDPETGELIARMRPPIPNVPIAWTSSTTWDPAVGEWGLCIFADRSLDEWKATGNRAVEPADPRRFDISDAVFLPGALPAAAPLPSSAVAAGAVVFWDRGTSDIRIGDSAASKWVALADDVLARLNLLESAHNSHVHLYVTPAIPSAAGPTASTTAPVTPTVLDDIRSTKVKASG
jgi:hypothetical protein